MNRYISFLRQHIGKAPVILCGSGVIIFNEKNELLMIKRTDNDCWAIPGGSSEPGESVMDTAKREVFEETGLTVNELELFNVYSGKEMHYIYPNGDEVYFVGIVFIGTDYTGSIRPDNIESKEIKFFPLDKIPEKINPPDIPIIKDIKNF